jgi:hypothetical protein
VDASGNVLLGASFVSAIDVGCGPVQAMAGGAVVAKLDASSGACVWSRAFPAADYGVPSVAADPSGYVVVTGMVDGAIDLGGGPLTSGSATNLFVAKLGSASGSYAWGKVFATSGTTWEQGVAVDAAGNVFLTGFFNGSVAFGGAPLGTVGGFDAFVASLDASGNYRWAKGFGDAQDQEAWGIAVAPSSRIVVVGGFQGTLDFGCNPLVSAGGTDVFVAELLR